MEQYISKSALVAEIEKKKEHVTSQTPFAKGARYGLEVAIDVVNTLEVKEVSFDREYKEFICCDNGRSMQETAKHFFELGLKVAQKGGEV